MLRSSAQPNNKSELKIADERVALPPPQSDSQSLDRSLVSGIAWTGGTKWATQLLSWAATLVVARILSPSDFGLRGGGPNARKAVAGRVHVGWEIATMPVEHISSLVSSVTPGIFSAVQHDIVALRRYFLGVLEGLAFITLPAAAGLALIAGEFVPVVLGPQWLGAIVPLRLLALYGGVRSIDTVTPQVLIYTGNSRQSMWYSVIAACVMPVLFVVGTRWGVGGVAAVWIVAYPLVVAPQYRLAFRVLEMRAGQYFKTLWPAVSSIAIMSVAVGLVMVALPQTLAPVIRLVLEVLVGIAVYGGMIAWRHRARARAFVSIVREHAL